MDVRNGAQAFVDVLNAWAVERVFFNPGIDTVPILEAISLRKESGIKSPEPTLCPHEAVAMTAALGNYMVSGHPQVVLVHSELGTQQVGGALHNAQWGRIPVVLCAGLSSTAERMDWQHNRFDQGRAVRNCVKWDHQLDDNEDIAVVLAEALRIAMTEPRGPVYLTWTMDVLRRESSASVDAASTVIPSSPEPQVGVLEAAADMLLAAERPVIISGFSGRNVECVASLVELAETVSAPVVSSDIRMNFPSTHPLFAYRDPVTGRRSMPYLEIADVLMVVDYDMPYASPRTGPRPDAKIIQIDIDIEKRGIPLWNRDPDIAINADTTRALPILTGILRRRLTPDITVRLKTRFERLKAEHEKFLAGWRSIAANAANQVPISADWLCQCIGEAIDDDTILLTQALRAAGSLPHHIARTAPGTLLASAGGTMGWALAAGLGAKLAAPESTVVSLMGDGVFVYGSPIATLWTASRYHAPFLSVIFNNQGYEAIRSLFRRKYDVDNMGADINPSPDYALVARGCKAYGRTVEDPSDLPDALAEAMDRVRNGQAAVVDVKLGEN